MELIISTEERVLAIEIRSTEIESEISRLNEEIEASRQQIRLLQLGRSGDATLTLVAIGALALAGFVQAAAIITLWWSQ